MHKENNVKGYYGFSLSELLVIFAIISIMIVISMPAMSVLTNKKSGVTQSVRTCIIAQNAASVATTNENYTSANLDTASKECAGAIRGCSNDDQKSCDSITHYINTGTSQQITAAQKLMRASCDLGGRAACNYFVSKCANGVCDEKEPYPFPFNDLRKYLMINYTDNSNEGRALVEELTRPQFNMSIENIVTEVETACELGIREGIINTACKIKDYMPEIRTFTYNFDPSDKPIFDEEDSVNGTVFSGGVVKLAKTPLSITTNEASDIKKFDIGADSYIAVANNYDGSSYNINSIIYKWNTSNKIFDNFQTIATNGATDWDSFIANSSTYLAVSNRNDGTTPNVNSKLYRWGGSNFVLAQSDILTNSAMSLKPFNIGSTTYLAVANAYNGSSYNIDSKVFKMSGATFDTANPINIPTNYARSWESFTIGTDSYIAVANFSDSGNFKIDSKIYKFNSSTGSFDFFQLIPTSGATDIEYFKINTDHYLAVANNYDGSSYDINSKIYKWDGTKFDTDSPIDISTSGATDWEAFTINNINYLAVANQSNDFSRIYQWNGTGFDVIQSISTADANKLESFTIGSDAYMAVANKSGASKIYQWSGAGFAQPSKDSYYILTSNNNHLTNVTKLISIAIKQDIPLLCTIKWLVSFDGRKHWKRWTGSGWSTVGLSSIYISGNTASELQTNLINYELEEDEDQFDIAIGFWHMGATGFVAPSVDQVKVVYQ